jgi:beta-glucanase (GH16 family)
MDAPDYAGYRKIWWDNFNGAAGASPDRSRWNILDKSSNANGELEVYTSSNKNVQISGGNTLQIIPQRNGSSWTSARLESTYIFTPEAGKVTVVEAHLSFGTDTHKQGIWPAFWFLGDSVRKTGSAYVVWPGCGEVDAFEMVSGKMTGFGTIHCDVYPGGICNEAKGIGNSIVLPNLDWHT